MGINGLGAVVVLPDYQRIMAEYPLARTTLPYPYYLAAHCVLMEAGLQIARQNQDEPSEQWMLRPVFDSHEEYSGRMKQTFDSFCSKNPLSSKCLLSPHYEDDKKYLSLQVADNIAFEVRKSVLQALGKQRRERISMKRLRDAGNIFKVFKLDYAGLKIIADANDPAILRPMDYTLDEIMGA